MRLGLILPTFREDVADAREAAARGVAAGVDGLFAYDHLWPMGSPERPSFAPLPVLAAIAREHAHVIVGPLVARVSLVGVGHLAKELLTLARVAPGGAIAAVGTGDAKSREEEEGYGLVSRSVAQRRDDLEALLVELGPAMPRWVGAGSASTNEIARRHGAALNVWEATADLVHELSTEGEVTWAGPLGSEPERRLDELARAGATWAVVTPGTDLAAIARWRGTREPE